eukprot:362825-Chlamydomonas_euryale.AAC.3
MSGERGEGWGGGRRERGRGEGHMGRRGARWDPTPKEKRSTQPVRLNAAICNSKAESDGGHGRIRPAIGRQRAVRRGEGWGGRVRRLPLLTLSCREADM